MRQEEVSTKISGKRRKEIEKLNVRSTKGGTAVPITQPHQMDFALRRAPLCMWSSLADSAAHTYSATCARWLSS
jgi:hypothetical protein